MEKPLRHEGESRKQAKCGPRATDRCASEDRVVRREWNPKEYAEKYRAVIDWGETPDEQVGQRWDQVEPVLWGGEGATHSPIVPRCLLTARYGRFMRDLRRPVGVLVFDQGKRPY